LWHSVISLNKTHITFHNIDEVTWYAAEYGFDVKEHQAGIFPLRVSYDPDVFSRLINYLTEREIRANHLLQ